MPKADLKLSSRLKDTHRSAATKAREGVGNVFPIGFNRLSIRIKKKTGSHAYTRRSDTQGQMVIKFNPRKHKSSDPDKRIGKLAQTLTHEMYLHARNDLNLLSQAQPTLATSVEHDRMHDPAHRQGFLDATHGTFDQLDNVTQKRAYAASWYKDMKNEIGDTSLSSQEQRARKTWARQRRDSMIDAISHRDRHNW